MSARDKKATGRSGQVSRSRVRAPVILVADDFDDNREMYSEYLEQVGFRVLEASDGRTAVEVARAELPAVILMDLSLPVVDGWEATRILKSDPNTRDIFIIAVTGYAEPASRLRATEAGCDAFITKPCLPAEIVRIVKKALDRPMSRAK